MPINETTYRKYRDAGFSHAAALSFADPVGGDLGPIPGAELAYSERLTSFYTNNLAIGTVVASAKPGLVCQVVGRGRPVDIEFFAGLVHSVANAGVIVCLIVNGNPALVAPSLIGVFTTPGTSSGEGSFLKRRMILTKGVSYTFEIMLAGALAGNVGMIAADYAPAYLSVTQR